MRVITPTEYVDIFNDAIVNNISASIQDIRLFSNYGETKCKYFDSRSGYKLCYVDYEFHDDTIIESAGGQSSSFLQFNRLNSLHIENLETKEDITLKEDSFGSGFKNKELNARTYFKKNTFYSYLNITIEDEIFKIITKKDNSSLRGKESFHLDSQKRINNLQKIIIKDIINAEYLDAKTQEIFLEFKLMELVLKSCALFDLPCKRFAISTNQKKTLYKAKEILLNNMANPPSIVELAHLVSTNEFKLKKDFKEFFGTTIYGMLYNHRMYYAKELLQSREVNVQEAAQIVGYKSVSQFTKAFKKMYNIVPLELIKKRVIENIEL